MAVFPINSKKASWASTISPSWAVTEQISASGRRRALSTQLLPKWVLSCKFNGLTNAQAAELLAFWNSMRGTFDTFYYKDFTYYKAENQALTKGADGKYQCLANIGGYLETVSKVDNLKVYVDGVETTDYTEVNGKITVAGTTVKASYEYYFKVHFSAAITITENFYDYNSVAVKMEVVR